ncbi:Ig-like domain-containing protein [Desulfosporosinus orientis DSM 765]|uniref:Ig-like domain-containing protein n=1 Tax=Desulfosporosinus orientis (strain ATCC 19365 / DSM 765 / NCIMB 8382 / VKM B-1628 / Singapore I) TaxID=768706 RepID=G7WBA5_DESOD|nr:Ig-like domain-containing protein [Desulfosporosinus orientis]AET67886.1 Ig-like domain-containing protein [Desulfosporosinus orientis DSM 765]
MKHMIKSMILVVLVFALILSGCSKEKASSQGEVNTLSSSASTAVWETLSGSFARNDSSQYNSATLQMKYLSNDCVMFEFDLMAGSESEDWSDNLVLPFVLLVDEDTGVGHYESDPDAENPLTIDLYLSEDGKQVTVTHTGEISISPDGVYDYIDDGLEVSENSAIAILDHLPAAVTSLNSNNGAYTIQYPTELVANWFYPVEATFDDNGVVLAKFLIAKDLSAVYRADDDIDPVLIFGSAQPMMDAEIYQYENTSDELSKDEDTSAGLSEDKNMTDEQSEDIIEGSDVLLPVVSVEMTDGIFLPVDAKSQLVAVMPWKLNYTLMAKSSDPSIVTVDESGAVTAVAVGEATISGTISVDDGQKDFSIDVLVK